MPSIRTSKEKEKVGSSSGTVSNREPEEGVGKFFIRKTTARCSNIISHWATLLERPVKLDDFLNFEMGTFVQICGWEKVVEQPHPIYEGLVREFYSNFNAEIDTPRVKTLTLDMRERKMDHDLT